MQRAKEIIFGDTKIADREHGLDNLLILTLNDKNGSSLKERVVISHLGIKSRENTKHGADGWMPDGRPVEYKPETYYEGLESSCLTGGANFNDLTVKKHKEHITTNLLMIVAGFYEENLLYLLKFPYRVIAPSVEDRMTNTIKENQGRSDGKSSRITPRFSFADYRNYRDVERVFLRKNIFCFSNSMNNALRDYIGGEFPCGNKSLPIPTKSLLWFYDNAAK